MRVPIRWEFARSLTSTVFRASLLALLLTQGAAGEDNKDKKEEPKPQPPRVAVCVPLAVSAGTTNLVQIRGQSLTNVTRLRFTNENVQPSFVIRSKAKADVPKDADAKKVGDTLLEVELRFPPDAAGTTNWVVLDNPDGVSEAKPLLVFAPDKLLGEKEPNGGFKTAQELRLGQTAAGVIKEAGDVDVFRFHGRRGQKVRLEVTAAALGSALDSSLTLVDAQGHLLAAADDTEQGPDSLLTHVLPADADYFVSLIDAHDKGGPTHAYLLRLSEER